LRTVYLGTSEFAAVVLERLAASQHRPVLVVTRPDRPQGRGRRLAPPPVALKARELGLDLIQPERLHEPEPLAHIAGAQPDVVCVCAYGVLIREPLLSAYEMLNVHPSLLPRWRGAAPVERAIMAGDAETGVSIMRLTAGLDSGPVCLQAREQITPSDDYGTLAARLESLGAELLVRALDERPAFVEQDEAQVTYAEKIVAADRVPDHTRPPEEAERLVRALRPHIGARLPLPDGTFLGVLAASVNGDTLGPDGGRVRTEGERLLLDCDGGALELDRIRPPGGREMATRDWLRGRPDPALTAFRLDPALPERPLAALVEGARREWAEEREWQPHVDALIWRGSREVLDAMRDLAGAPADPAAGGPPGASAGGADPAADGPSGASAVRADPAAGGPADGPDGQRDPATVGAPGASAGHGDAVGRAVAAHVLGQLGGAVRAFPDEQAAALNALAAREDDPEVLSAVAHAFGHLGEPHGIERLAGWARHPDPRVREGVAFALGGWRDERALAALAELAGDPVQDVRDWATFALGTLAPHDTPALRDALAERLADPNPDTRLEAVHGLALRGDPRAAEAAPAILDAAAAGAATPWRRHLVRETAARLAAATGDDRFARFQ
jgi:methionyl-tRNA formyltransferase